MNIVRRAGVGFAASVAVILAGCSGTQHLSGTISDINGQYDMYSIQLSGSDKVWQCSTTPNPICRLLKKGDTISFMTMQFDDDGMREVTRENTG